MEIRFFLRVNRVKRYDWVDVEELAEHLFDEYDYMLPWCRDTWNIIMFQKVVTKIDTTKSQLSISDQSDILLWLITLYDLYYDYLIQVGVKEGVVEYEVWNPNGYEMKAYNAKKLGEQIQCIQNWEKLISEFVKETVYRRLVERQDIFLDQDSCISDYETISEQTNKFENVLDYTIDNLVSNEIRDRREKCIEHIYKFFNNNEVKVLFFMAGYHARDNYSDYRIAVREIERWQSEALSYIEEQELKEEEVEMDESDIEWEYEQKIADLNDEYPVSIQNLEEKVNDFDYIGEISPIYDWISREMDRIYGYQNSNKSEYKTEKQDLFKVIVREVFMTLTEETYYVSAIDSTYSDTYSSGSIKETENLLIEDGWRPAGKVVRWDYTSVDMWERKSELIAIWLNEQ